MRIHPSGPRFQKRRRLHCHDMSLTVVNRFVLWREGIAVHKSSFWRISSKDACAVCPASEWPQMRLLADAGRTRDSAGWDRLQALQHPWIQNLADTAPSGPMLPSFATSLQRFTKHLNIRWRETIALKPWSQTKYENKSPKQPRPWTFVVSTGLGIELNLKHQQWRVGERSWKDLMPRLGLHYPHSFSQDIHHWGRGEEILGWYEWNVLQTSHLDHLGTSAFEGTGCK